MRARLLDAAVDCLCETGYAGMSTNDVVRRAAVSRGALAHHFPTKADLVAAVAEQLMEQRAAEFHARFGNLPVQRRTGPEALDVLWSLYDDRAYFALLELTVAARSDDELRGVLAGVPEQLTELTHTTISEYLPDLAQIPFIEDIARGIEALFTGLAVHSIVDGDARGRHAAVRELMKFAIAGAQGSSLLSSILRPDSQRSST